jgi:hypothetical protein
VPKQKLLLFTVLIPLAFAACAKKKGSARPAASAAPASPSPAVSAPSVPAPAASPVAQSQPQQQLNRPSHRTVPRRRSSAMNAQKTLAHAVFGNAAIIRCRFEPTGVPMSYLEYHIKSRVAYTTTGWPQVTRVYKDVRLTNTLPPYGNVGVTLLAFQDSPLIHIRRGGIGHIWYEQGTTYPFEATWGLQPGAPTREARLGVCWTPQEPAVQQYNN